MKVSYNWLKEILQFSLSPQEVADALTGAGFPVEEIAPISEALEGVVVAELLEVRPHPNADRLSLTKVSDGTNVYDVVCGAKNISAGDKVPFAPVGTVLPGNFQLKRAKIRGEESEGMLCSSEELRLDVVQASDGILQLPRDGQPGQSLAEFLRLDDVILDIELTANRSDLLCVRGLAAEVSAILGKPFSMPRPNTPEVEDYKISVSIETESCPRYTGRLIKGVKVQPSPLWLQIRLLACGMRPVNNIVDITNMVMLEWGQPLHAFDADKLPGAEINVRQARSGETIVTLDGKERKLEPHMMLITSGDKPVAIAGVMGSLESEVDENTCNILLESAGFDPVSIRLTGKALGLTSEASGRYEKGVDPAAIVLASDRAAALIRDLAGGTIGLMHSAGTDFSTAWAVEASMARINGLLGTDIARERAAEILINLGLEVTGEGDLIQVGVDGRRPDLKVWQDIAEEVGRLYGMDQIPATLPLGKLTQGIRTPRQHLEWQVREILTGCGLYEVVPYSFISPEMAEKSEAEPGVEISNPLTRERSVMRGSILPSLLEILAHNLAHGHQGVAIYEMGGIYQPNPGGELPNQTPRVAGVLAGAKPGHWQNSAGSFDFYDIKGIVEQLLTGLGVQPRFQKGDQRWFHPGRCAAVFAGECLLGYLGQVHPTIGGRWKLEEKVWFFDLDYDALANFCSESIAFDAPSRYPAIRRDLALETDLSGEAGSLVDIIREVGGGLLESVDCFDVYSGPNLGENRKSLAFALSFRHKERTLKDKEVQALVDKMVVDLEKAGGRLRS